MTMTMIQPISNDQAAFYAATCKYWKVSDAQTGFVLGTSLEGEAFENIIEKAFSTPFLKILKLSFGSNKNDRQSTFYLYTPSYSEDSEEPLLVMQQQQKQQAFAGFAGFAGAGRSGFNSDSVNAMIQAAVAQANLESMKQMQQFQFDMMQKQLEAQVKMHEQTLEFERQKLEMERRHFEELQEKSGPDIWDKAINGLKQLAPIAGALAGIKIEGEEDSDEDQDEGAGEEPKKPKGGKISFQSED